MIIVLTILYGFGAITNTQAWAGQHQTDPYWPGDLIESIIDTLALIALAGIWMWRRWAAWLLIAAGGLEILYEFVVHVEPATPLTKLVALAILMYTIFDQWKSFEPCSPKRGTPSR
jgi:hypothetical protein